MFDLPCFNCIIKFTNFLFIRLHGIIFFYLQVNNWSLIYSIHNLITNNQNRISSPLPFSLTKQASESENFTFKKLSFSRSPIFRQFRIIPPSNQYPRDLKLLEPLCSQCPHQTVKRTQRIPSVKQPFKPNSPGDTPRAQVNPFTGWMGTNSPVVAVVIPIPRNFVPR